MWRTGPMEMEPCCSPPVAAGACGIAREAREARPFSMPGLRRQDSIEFDRCNQILPASEPEPIGLTQAAAPEISAVGRRSVVLT